MNSSQLAPGIFTVEAFLTSSECDALIWRAEVQGFEKAAIATSGSHKVEPKTRNNDRVIIDDPQLASAFWTRIGEFTPRANQAAAVIAPVAPRFQFWHPGRHVTEQRRQLHRVA